MIGCQAPRPGPGVYNLAPGTVISGNVSSRDQDKWLHLTPGNRVNLAGLMRLSTV